MIGSVHNFAHDTAAELSCHVQIYELIAPFNSNFSQDMDYKSSLLLREMDARSRASTLNEAMVQHFFAYVLDLHWFCIENAVVARKYPFSN